MARYTPIRARFTVPAGAGSYATEFYGTQDTGFPPAWHNAAQISPTVLATINAVAGVTLESWVPIVPNPRSISDYVLGGAGNGPQIIRCKSGGTGGTHDIILAIDNDGAHQFGDSVLHPNFEAPGIQRGSFEMTRVQFTVPATLNNYAPEKLYIRPGLWTARRTDISAVAGVTIETWVALGNGTSTPPADGEYVYYGTITSQEFLAGSGFHVQIRAKSGGTSGTHDMLCHMILQRPANNTYPSRNLGSWPDIRTLTATVSATPGAYAAEEWDGRSNHGVSGITMQIVSLPTGAAVEIYGRVPNDASSEVLVASLAAAGNSNTTLNGMQYRIRVVSGGTSGSAVLHAGTY